jgi:hypothetical protein
MYLVKRNSDLRLIHRLQLHAARQIAWDLLLLSIPKGMKSPPGRIRKMVLRARVWLFHCVLRHNQDK